MPAPSRLTAFDRRRWAAVVGAGPGRRLPQWRPTLKQQRDHPHCRGSKGVPVSPSSVWSDPRQSLGWGSGWGSGWARCLQCPTSYRAAHAFESKSIPSKKEKNLDIGIQKETRVLVAPDPRQEGEARHRERALGQPDRVPTSPQACPQLYDAHLHIRAPLEPGLPREC